MKIINEGVVPEVSAKRFECQRCGCVFDAENRVGEEKEYFNGDINDLFEYSVDSYAKCPSCGEWTYRYVAGRSIQPVILSRM